MNTDLAAQGAFDRLDRVGFDGLTDAERTVATVWLFDARVANGDLASYFSSQVRPFYGLGTGRRMVKTEPLPSSLLTLTEPPCTCTMCLTMARPRPVPPTSRLRALSTR